MKHRIWIAAFVCVATTASAQHLSHPNSNMEPGQSQFAAIAEIVAILREDPNTDWERVNVTALRDHLVDMDNVTTKAVVETALSDMMVTFTITGDAAVAASIRRMVMAHRPMLQQSTGWGVTVSQRPDGAMMELRLNSSNESDLAAGLGFFGVMTIGAHHQQHHLMISKGHSPH